MVPAPQLPRGSRHDLAAARGQNDANRLAPSSFLLARVDDRARAGGRSGEGPTAGPTAGYK